MTVTTRLIRHLVCALLMAGSVAVAQAQLVLPTIDQGHIRRTTLSLSQQVEHFIIDTRMNVKAFSLPGPLAATVADRAYAFFDLPMGLGSAFTATLSFDATLAGPDATTLFMQEISAPFADFQTSHTGNNPQGLNLFTDLGIGVPYADPLAVPAGNSQHRLTLSSFALADIQASQGQIFGIGFSTAFLSVDNPMQLSNMTLEITPVPEPGSMALLLAGMGLLALRRKAA